MRPSRRAMERVDRRPCPRRRSRRSPAPRRRRSARWSTSSAALHGKVIQAAKKRDETLRRQFTRAQAQTFPHGQPQERTLGVPFFLNRYGPALVDRLLRSCRLDLGQHWVMHDLSSDASERSDQRRRVAHPCAACRRLRVAAVEPFIVRYERLFRLRRSRGRFPAGRGRRASSAPRRNDAGSARAERRFIELHRPSEHRLRDVAQERSTAAPRDPLRAARDQARRDRMGWP